MARVGAVRLGGCGVVRRSEVGLMIKRDPVVDEQEVISLSAMPRCWIIEVVKGSVRLPRVSVGVFREEL